MFHIAITTNDLEKSRSFYGSTLQCAEGRVGVNWVDFDFFGNQLTIQYISDRISPVKNHFHPTTNFPLEHWGIVLDWEKWHQLKEKLEYTAGVEFIVQPQTVMKGEVGEQSTFMITDPDGNPIEFKTFRDLGNVFRSK